MTTCRGSPMERGTMNDSLRTLLDLLVDIYREEYFAKKMWRKVYGFRDLPNEYIAVAFACTAFTTAVAAVPMEPTRVATAAMSIPVISILQLAAGKMPP